jgi:hypothetical protein
VKNAETRNGDRMNILQNRIRVRKDSLAHSVSLDWRKTILVASQFSRFYTASVIFCRATSAEARLLNP